VNSYPSSENSAMPHRYGDAPRVLCVPTQVEREYQNNVIAPHARDVLTRFVPDVSPRGVDSTARNPWDSITVL